MNIPKSWLIHSIKYEEYTNEKDDYGNQKYEEPITIDYVRFDDSILFSRDNTDTKIQANAIVFVDSKHSTNLPNKFIEQSKVTFNGDYVIKKVVDCYYPNKNKIHHWELELV